MDFMGLTSVAVITVLCYLVAALIKTTPLNNKWLPAICGVLGGILGIIGMNVMPYYPASDPLTALAVGVASGLAATGSNQVFKQLVNKSK